MVVTGDRASHVSVLLVLYEATIAQPWSLPAILEYAQCAPLAEDCTKLRTIDALTDTGLLAPKPFPCACAGKHPKPQRITYSRSSV